MRAGLGGGLVGIAVAAMLSGCGPAARLTELACQEPCQSVHDPFLLKLTVGYEDPQGLLADGRLLVRLNDDEIGDYALGPLLTPGVTSGRIPLDLKVDLGKVSDGQKFVVRVRATFEDDETNELSLPLIVKL